MNVHASLHLNNDAAQVQVSTYEDNETAASPAYAAVTIAANVAIFLHDIETAEAMADAFTSVATHLRRAARARDQIVLVAV